MQSPLRKLSMNEAAAHWAKITGVPRPHRATLIRWATKGVRGQRLDAEALAGRWYTTTEAIESFLRHLTLRPPHEAGRTAGPTRAAQVQRALDDLDKKIAPRRPDRRKPR